MSAQVATTLIEGLLINFGFLALMVSAWVFAPEAVTRLSPRANRMGVAIVSAGAVALLMGHPFEVEPGLRFDLRSVPLALGGLFGGPIAGLATLGVASALRFAAGGAAVPTAIASMVVVASFGIVGHALLKARPVRLRDVVTLAALAAGTSLVALLSLPRGIFSVLTLAELFALIGVLFAATAATGAAIVGELRRRAVERENRMYRAVIDSLPEPISAKDRDGRFLLANPPTAQLLRAPDVAVLIGKTDADFFPAEQAAVLEREDRAAMDSGHPAVIERQVVGGDGTSVWLASLKAPLFDDEHAVAGLVTHHRDISDRKRLEFEHDAARRQLDDAIASMADGFVIFDRDERIVLCNQRYRDFFPLTAHLRVPGTRLEDVLRATIETHEQRIPAGTEEAWIERVRGMLRAPSEGLFELTDGRWIHGRLRPMSDGSALGVMSDVTKSRRTEQRLAELNQRLEILARYDGLTGLTNRRAFEEIFAAELARSRRTGAPLGLLMLDLDKFKAYNDTYGHLAGDQCLRRIGNALRSALKRPGDLAARYGGEEFIAILPETDLAATMACAEAVRLAVHDLAIPHVLGAHGGIVTVSIGVAVRSGPGGDTLRHLIGRADRALYAAKAAGRDRVFSDEMATAMQPAANG